MKTELTIAQHFILTYAHEKTGDKIVEFPDNIKGGARKKVLEGLHNRSLITTDGTDWFISAEGYDAIGVPRKESEPPQIVGQAKPRTRDQSKQALVIEMLKRPEGATISQICEATMWQPHTVRGTLAGALKTRHRLEITSTKEEGGERVYRIK